jgi:serine/threonine protein kinase
MSVNIFSPSLRARRREWTSRTADLDTSTSDLLEEHTSDLDAVPTQDVQPRPTTSVDAALLTDWVQPLELPQGEAPPVEKAPRGTQDLAVEENVAAVNSPSTPPTARKTSVKPKQQTIAPGLVLKDRYLLENSLGTGGTALVFSARDLHAAHKSVAGARIAVKIPRPDAKDLARGVARLQHEFRHAHPLTHPNIVRVFDLTSDDQSCFMTMELIEGKSLAALLREWPTIDEARKRRILRSCADALIYAHRNDIVHGDFKPANVLVDSLGNAKVFDFGAASAATGEDTRIPAGTPAYASPEVLSGQRPERRDDVFSFACVAYELLTGQHPFDRRSSLEVREQGMVPARAWNLSASQWLALLSALSWDREQRPAEIDSLMEALVPAKTDTHETKAAASPAVLSVSEPALADDLIPAQRGWGFFVFVAVAFAVVLIFIAQRQMGDAGDTLETIAAPAHIEDREPAADLPPPAVISPAAGGLMSSAPLNPSRDEPSPISESSQTEIEPEVFIPPAAPPKPAAAVSTLSFDARSIVTTESSIAAVFVVKRTVPSGRTTVHWTAKSGTAKAGDDFIANANGTVEFADGQTQRAIYIPLRNDVEQESDETFTVELTSTQRGRLGEISRVEATIRDDD